MSPVTHALVSWLAAEWPREGCRRDRLLVVTAGIIPDIDGLGLLAQLFWEGALHRELPWYHQYHHLLAHNLFFALLVAGAAYGLARRRAATAFLASLAFHLHLLCDLAGSRGSEPEDLWPVHYFYPLWPDHRWLWEGQWPMVSWQNLLVTVMALGWIGVLAVDRGRSPVELFSPRADALLVHTLRHRFAPGARGGECP